MTTPAAELARVKATWPSWAIRRVTSGEGYTAQRGEYRLWAKTLPDLERALAAAANGNLS